jgi:hypothetical protein
MLSVDYCKKYLKQKNKYYSNEEIEEIRNCLYQSAEILVEKYLQKKYHANAHHKQNSKFPIHTST